MIDFEGYYLVPPDQVAYIETRRGGGDAQYGLFLGLTGGERAGRVVQNRGGAKSRLYEARTTGRDRETTGQGGHLVSPAVDRGVYQ